MSTTQDTGGSTGIHKNAKKLLLALANSERDDTTGPGQATTTDLKEPTNLSASNISGRHAKTLIREGWAEKIGSEDTGGPNAANIYEVTPQGRKKAKALEKELAIPMAKEDRDRQVQNLQERVDELEGIVEQMDGRSEPVDTSHGGEISARLEQNSDQLERHRSMIDDNTSRIEQIEGMIRGIMEEIGLK